MAAYNAKGGKGEGTWILAVVVRADRERYPLRALIIYIYAVLHALC